MKIQQKKNISNKLNKKISRKNFMDMSSDRGYNTDFLKNFYLKISSLYKSSTLNNFFSFIFLDSY